MLGFESLPLRFPQESVFMRILGIFLVFMRLPGLFEKKKRETTFAFRKGFSWHM